MAKGSSIIIAIILISCTSCARSHVRAALPETGPVQPGASLAQRVHFPTGSAQVLSTDHAALDNNARWISENPAAVIVLEGHCDERGSDALNMELGDMRARSVAAQLAQKGADISRFVIVSQGEGAPLDARHTEAAWKKNRRVEFVVR